MVSIIIVNYNTPRLTCACIESIFKHVKSCEYEIIVVDNASKDDSIKILNRNFESKIILIQSLENVGFGRANNLGAKNAKGEYLFLLNSDTILINDPFKYFIPFYKSSSSVGAIGSYLIDGESKFSLSGGSIYSAKKYLKMALNAYSNKKSVTMLDNNRINEVGYVIGADLFISKKLFQDLNGFDKNIFMYFEDVELCDRIIKLGKSNYLIPGPLIMHFVKSSSTSQFSRLYNTASLMYCLRKSMGLLKFKIFQFLYLVLKLPILLRFGQFRENWKYINSIIHYKHYLLR